MFVFRPKKSRVPNYLARSEQYKLLGLVMMLGMLLIVIPRVADPETWNWLLQMSRPQVAVPKALDTHLKGHNLPARDTLEPNVLVAAVQVEPPAEGKPAVEPPQAAPEFPQGWLTGLRAEEFRDVEDDTKLRANERLLAVKLLRQLANLDPAALHQLSLGSAEYVQLYDQMSAYRGRVVTLRGTVRSVMPIEAPADNGQNITQFYELWVSPQERPIERLCVFALNWPMQVPPVGARDLEQPVEFDAVLLKRMAYMSKDRQWFATPLMIAGPIRLLPVPPKPAEKKPITRNDTTIVISLVILGAIVAGTVMAFSLRRPAGLKQAFAGRQPLKPGESFGYEKLRGLEVDPEVLRQLHDAESKSAPDQPQGPAT